MLPRRNRDILHISLSCKSFILSAGCGFLTSALMQPSMTAMHDQSIKHIQSLHLTMIRFFFCLCWRCYFYICLPNNIVRVSTNLQNPQAHKPHSTMNELWTWLRHTQKKTHYKRALSDRCLSNRLTTELSERSRSIKANVITIMLGTANKYTEQWIQSIHPFITQTIIITIYCERGMRNLS